MYREMFHNLEQFLDSRDILALHAAC